MPIAHQGKADRDQPGDYPDGGGWRSVEGNSVSLIGRAPAILDQARDNGADLGGIVAITDSVLPHTGACGPYCYTSQRVALKGFEESWFWPS